jgi:hypothetical protein
VKLIAAPLQWYYDTTVLLLLFKQGNAYKLEAGCACWQQPCLQRSDVPFMQQPQQCQTLKSTGPLTLRKQ